ncbi:MAG: hypothetical protein WD226_02135 [Planctomycetota bacterium]
MLLAVVLDLALALACGLGAPGASSADDELFTAVLRAPPGEAAELALATLRANPVLEPGDLETVWGFVQRELAALRLVETEPLLAALHERYRAPWTAVNLALVRQKLGDYRAVDALFEATVRAERRRGNATGGLTSQWGILVLGTGDEARARTLLERAYALGSDDAAVVLARWDLALDRPRTARRRVRALMLSPEPPAWAQRTWGLALLTPRRPLSDLK